MDVLEDVFHLCMDVAIQLQLYRMVQNFDGGKF